MPPERARLSGWPVSDPRRILGGMARPVRITRVDGAALADCLYLIGQAFVSLEAGDAAGFNEAHAAAEQLVPAAGINEILRMVEAGELPLPDPAAMDEWLEACRMAGSGELVLYRILFPSAAELAQEEHDAFMTRLDEIRADAERRAASGETPWRPDVPERPPPWEVDALTGLERPGSLSEELRKMGLM
jgi:hypothetical protein